MMALGIDEDTLDPEGQTTATVSNVVDYMYDPLVWYNDERPGVAPGQPQYDEAHAAAGEASWTVIRDGRTFSVQAAAGGQVPGRYGVRLPGGEIQHPAHAGSRDTE